MISNKTTNCTNLQTCHSIRFAPMYTSRKNSDGTNTLVIVYDNPEVEFHHTYVSYDLLTLVGELGGILGLTMGCSGMSLIESVLDQISKFPLLTSISYKCKWVVVEFQSYIGKLKNIDT